MSARTLYWLKWQMQYTWQGSKKIVHLYGQNMLDNYLH